MKKSLETLFPHLSRSEFIKHYRQNGPVVSHNQEKLLEELKALPLLESLDSLLSSWPMLVNAYQAGPADEINSVKLNTVEAKNVFYNKKRALYFDDPNHISPLIEKWVQGIRSDLGLSGLTYARSLIYALPDGAHTDPHFDQNINFILQVSGTKKWWVAPNSQIKNPLTRHTMGQPEDPELASYLETALPINFEEIGAIEYILHPGSILFLPRGAWHRTESIGDSIALNLTFTAPTWIDILMTALRGRLAQSTEWRSTADFVGDSALSCEAKKIFDSLLNDLAQDVPTWCAEDILATTEMVQYPL